MGQFIPKGGAPTQTIVLLTACNVLVGGLVKESFLSPGLSLLI